MRGFVMVLSDVIDPPAGTPWWAWALVAIGSPLLTAVAGTVVALVIRALRRDMRATHARADVAATELEPNHGSSSKDQLGRVEAMLRTQGRQMKKLMATADELHAADTRQEAAQRRHDAEIGGLRDDVRAVSGRLDDHLRVAPRPTTEP